MNATARFPAAAPPAAGVPSALNESAPGTASMLLDPTLAAVLSRLAALLGHAVPAHRFGMCTVTSDGVAVQRLERIDRAVAMWRARFTQAEVKLRSGSDAQGLRAPALWVSANGLTVLVVRGLLSGGRYVAENDAGQTLPLGAAEASAGSFLELGVGLAMGRESEAQALPRNALSWFRQALRARWSVFLEAVVATALISAIGLASSLYTMQVYDRVVPTRSYSTLWVLTVGVAIAVVLELGLKQVRAAMVDRVCKAIDQELSARFFGRALSIRMDARPPTVGTFAAQIRQFETVRNFLTSSTLFVLAEAPFALLFITIIALIAGPLALVPLAFLPLATLSAVLARSRLAQLAQMNIAESDRKNGLLIESIDGIESVKAASGEWKMLDGWQRLTAQVGEGELRMRAISTGSTNLTQALQQLSYVGLIMAGVHAIGSGELTMGGLMACSIISGRALGPLAQVSGFVVQWQMAKAALKGLDQLVALPVDGPVGERPIIPERCQGELRMEKVRFGYADGPLALNVPQLLLRPGDRVAVLGSVGSGKTTLIKLLSGLYRASEGRAFLDGIDMALIAPEFVREHVGYLPQDVRLFHGTLRDNLTLGLPSPSDGQILTAARLTGLDAIVAAHPKGLSLELPEGGRGLSGGQRQLVGLTRLLLAQPHVLLLDEPTASMDGDLEARVMKAMFGALNPRALAVVVTHKLSMLQHVNRVIVMEHGRIVLDGPRDEVLQRLKERADRLRAAPSTAVAEGVAA